MSEKASETFRKWKEDLEKRLAEHLWSHPEDKSEIKKNAQSKFVVDVYETLSGAWGVRRNGTVLMIFYGPESHIKASSYAGKVSQESDSDLISSTPCPFCGGYGQHRSGCTDNPPQSI